MNYSKFSETFLLTLILYIPHLQTHSQMKTEMKCHYTIQFPVFSSNHIIKIPFDLMAGMGMCLRMNCLSSQCTFSIFSTHRAREPEAFGFKSHTLGFG